MKGIKRTKGRDRSVGVRGGRGGRVLQPGAQTRKEKEEMHCKECERGQKSVGGRRDDDGDNRGQGCRKTDEPGTGSV